MLDKPKEAESILSEAVEVLQWGCRVWAKVPSEQRGVIFEQAFVRRVRCMHMEAFLKVHPLSASLRTWDAC
jgi:hypothetical protein